jgi:hypothetical protein
VAFPLYMYYNTNWFIPSIFFLFVPLAGLKILYSFLYRKSPYSLFTLHSFTLLLLLELVFVLCLSPTYERKHEAFFLAWLTSLTIVLKYLKTLEF